MRLKVDPIDGPVDVTPSIRVEGAEPGAAVELTTEAVDAAGHHWRFQGAYKADGEGLLDLSRDAPTDSAYEGADPGGPIWAMEFTDEGKAPVGFTPSDDRLAFTLTAASGSETATQELTRRWRQPDIEITALGGSRFHGELFHPAGASSAAVLVVPGSMGAKAMRPFAAVLASHGFHVHLISYMEDEGLPPGMQEIPIELVGEALDALRAETSASRVAVVSASVGTPVTLAALSLGTAEADCAAAVSPSSVVWQALPEGEGGPPPKASSLSLGGEPLPWLPLHGERLIPELIKHAVVKRFARHPHPTAMHMLPAYEPALKKADDVERAAIAVEKIACPLFLVTGEDDEMWPGAAMVRQMTERRQAAGVAEHDISLIYPEAGHFFRPPLTPTTVPWAEALVSGGTAAGNARAEVEGWPQLIEFLKTHLTPAA